MVIASHDQGRISNHNHTIHHSNSLKTHANLKTFVDEASKKNNKTNTFLSFMNGFIYNHKADPRMALRFFAN